jgi:Asp-tRNA(Asn)/Glu-tRNA(Gln) amidotransferase A subunit family amidase
VQVIDDEHVLVVAVTELARGGRGQQTQLWARDPGSGAWQVTAAHVSVPAPALDTRIWRVVGDPLVPGADDGPLSGETVAVKDLYVVAGHRVGAGNPAWLEQARVEPESAYAVRALLDAGAAVRGIARTDEFAYSLAGTNAHYGTPPNPTAPHRVSGGSSSGSASAVSLGHATIGLGTDTGGSVRVPAAYQGLYGIRTTHGAVPRSGLLPLAPTFDTVGWLTRSARLLQAVGDALLPEQSGADPAGSEPELVVVPELLGLAEPEVAAAVTAWLPGPHRVETWPLGSLQAWVQAFQTVQAHEAWRSHGDWLAARLDSLGTDVRGRFERAAAVTDAEAEEARAVASRAGELVREMVGDRVLVLPSASSVAPEVPTGPATGSGGPAMSDRLRQATLRLTCLAGLGGLPAASVPTRTAGGLPVGVCLLAAPGRDRDLLALAARLEAEH